MILSINENKFVYYSTNYIVFRKIVFKYWISQKGRIFLRHSIEIEVAVSSRLCVNLLDVKPGFEIQASYQNEI